MTSGSNLLVRVAIDLYFGEGKMDFKRFGVAFLFTLIITMACPHLSGAG